MDSYRSYRAINCQFVPGFECIYTYSYMLHFISLSDKLYCRSRKSPLFYFKFQSNTLLKIQVDILTIWISLD